MSSLTRRDFVLGSVFGAASVWSGSCALTKPRSRISAPGPLNMIFIMCDDLGYGDVGFNGNEVIRTPSLDELRNEGACFQRFHAGAPVCSPTRGTCLTGRHYARYGITHANQGRLPKQEITLAEVCRKSGYVTGHFGKWHLGTLTMNEKDSNRGGPEHPEFYSPPWQHGFDVCFSTEALVPTWNPSITPAEGNNRWGTPGTRWKSGYWNERGERVTDNLSGDDSRVIVDRVEPFIRSSVAGKKPFLAVIWFHTPHAPIVAGPEYRALYERYSEGEPHYYGCVTAMDEQVGRINALIKSLGAEENTMIWFCSDNGPEGTGNQDYSLRFHGLTGGLRGRKRSLFNGGVTVPALVKWPMAVTPGSTYSMPCSTLDYFPTVVDLLDYQMPDSRPIDGISLIPLLRGQMLERPRPIPYRFLETKRLMFDAPTLAMIDNRYKFLTNLSPEGTEDLCFDLLEDPFEQRNIVSQMPEYASEMRGKLHAFIDSCRRSHAGADYPGEYTPVNEFQELTGTWK
ncbi:MAG: sulfatase-like hydrolase/transferase [bacterium]